MFSVSDLSKGEKDPGGWGVHVEPTKRLLKLDPEKAIDELQTFVDNLKDFLRSYNQKFTKEDFKKPDNLTRVREVVFQIDVCESYLDYLKKQHKTIH